ncbi:hypothetical protein P5V15_011385 [Pogonomyrmex californicus]
MNLLSAPQRIGSPRGSTAEANREVADFAELFGGHEPAECSATHREPRGPMAQAKKEREKKKKKKKGSRNVRRTGEDRKDVREE